MRKACFGIVIAVIFTASLAHGHGVTYTIVEEQGIAVHFSYAGGEPMSYAETKVFGPESSPDLEFQNGRTDARGIFAFVPDCPGSWRVEAFDNLGHKGSMEIVVEKTNTDLAARREAGAQKEDSTLLKILLALSVIANLAIAAAFLKRPKQT